MGAQIMGLGAFTKVVGDAGIMVAKRARIPVTTGNSYSASGALWAAADAMRRMGLVKAEKEEDSCKTMVVGRQVLSVGFSAITGDGLRRSVSGWPG